MATPSQFSRLFELLNEIAKEQIDPQTFKYIRELSKTQKHLAGMQQEDLIGSLLNEAYIREPAAFEQIKWVNTPLGTPLWVRPGEEWTPDIEEPEAQTLTSLLEGAGAEIVSINRRPLTKSDVVDRLLKKQEMETADELELFINYWEP